MSKVRPSPCEACPYRRDVPSGLWARQEYEKLRAYDAETPQQPMATFACHATPQAYCHGWAVVHMTRGHDRELLALRVWPPEGGLPEPVVPLFASGTEAADHGERDIDDPSGEALRAMSRLVAKHPRLQEED